MTTTPSPNSNQNVVNEQNLFTAPWYIYLQAIYKAIRAKFKLNLAGILSINTTSTSNSGTAETDLITYTLAANDLQNNGDVLEIKGSGYFAVNSNNKEIKLKFGSQTIFDSGVVAANNTAWQVIATIARVSSISQIISVSSILNNTAYCQHTIGTQDLTTDLVIKFTAQGSATNDITEDLLIIGLTPND